MRVLVIILFLVVRCWCQYANPRTQFVAFSYSKATLSEQTGFLSFSKQLLNYNACFKSQYGAFVAQQPGLYFFTFTAVTPDGDHFRLSLKQNKLTLIAAYAERQGYQSATQSAIAYLTYNDTVYLKLEEGKIYESPIADRAYTSFSGYLLHSLGPPVRPLDPPYYPNGQYQPSGTGSPYQPNYPMPGMGPNQPMTFPGTNSYRPPVRDSLWSGLFRPTSSSSARVNFPNEKAKQVDTTDNQIQNSVWPFEGALILEQGRNNSPNNGETEKLPRQEPTLGQSNRPDVEAAFPMNLNNPCGSQPTDNIDSELPGKAGQPCSRK